MSDTGRSIDGADELKDNLTGLKEDIDDRVHRLKTGADEATRTLLNEIAEGLATFYKEVTSRAGRAAEAVEERVEDQPWLGVLVSFALGCLVGLLILRRD
jgi:ElaB/YqjD/DUF883 family membrane-anchored ribosome-binding protein